MLILIDISLFHKTFPWFSQFNIKLYNVSLKVSKIKHRIPLEYDKFYQDWNKYNLRQYSSLEF